MTARKLTVLDRRANLLTAAIKWGDVRYVLPPNQIHGVLSALRDFAAFSS
jgi:hypothetical protein